MIFIRTTGYKIRSASFGGHKRFALVSDLHSGSPKKVIERLRRISPDYILLAGDIFENLDGSLDAKNEKAFSILEECAMISPSFYSTGNHEDGATRSQKKKWKQNIGKGKTYSKENIERIKKTGVNLLVDDCILVDGIAFGGLGSALMREGNVPDLAFLERFASLKDPKVLICHHPEYYEPYIRVLPIDITVSGHAHGGQWRIFGRGVFAPGQGLFPKYTSGVYEGRLVVSRGLKCGWPIPRFFNPREIVVIDVL